MKRIVLVCLMAWLYSMSASAATVLVFSVDKNSPVICDGGVQTVGTYTDSMIPEINLVRCIIGTDIPPVYIGGGMWDDATYGILPDDNEGWRFIQVKVPEGTQPYEQVYLELGWADLDADENDPASDFHTVAVSDIFILADLERDTYEAFDINPSAPEWIPQVFYAPFVPVPEPSVVTLCLFGACALLLRRRHA